MRYFGTVSKRQKDISIRIACIKSLAIKAERLVIILGTNTIMLMIEQIIRQ